MSHMQVLASLSYQQILGILAWLCEDDSMQQKIIEKAKQYLTNVNQAKIEREVFQHLNGIDLQDLFECSGKTYYGYNDPSEEAFFMLEEALDSFVGKMKDCRSLGLKEEERKYCQGIYYGLIYYDKNGTNEFHSWVPDDVYILAGNILEEWKEYNDASDWEEGSARPEVSS